jgi:hypothetical protein
LLGWARLILATPNRANLPVVEPATRAGPFLIFADS